jgi:hypothetical protein|tara:strand:- start:84 stop:299 length:216 start_codon:yes stop_codon:yes gene_type:complete
MSTQYKENNFSTASSLISDKITKNNINKITRPNIDHLIKRIIVERRRERRNITVLGVVCLSIIIIFVFFLN